MGDTVTDRRREAPVLPTNNEPMRVAIIVENFLPKVDGSTITISHLLHYLNETGVQAMLFGPESGMNEYAGAQLFGTFGIPMRVYPGLKINFISPAFLRALRAFAPHVIHLIDPIWLGVQTLSALAILFPSTPIITSHHTNLPTYAAVFGYPYWHHRTWTLQGFMHSFAKCTLVPTESTKVLLEERRGWKDVRMRVVGRGVDRAVFDPSLRSEKLRLSWGVRPTDAVILSVGRLSPEKNLSLLVHAFAALAGPLRANAKLVFVGDGPYRTELQRLCITLGVRDAVFTGHLGGKALGEAVASGDMLCSPSITETFGQVTLQGMAAGLPVLGLYVEGTADLVVHGVTGLLLDPLSADYAPPPPALKDADGSTGVATESASGKGYSRGAGAAHAHDSAVSLSLDLPPLSHPRHRDSTTDCCAHVEEEEERVPDSAISFSPDVSFLPQEARAELDADAFVLPPPAMPMASSAMVLSEPQAESDSRPDEGESEGVNLSPEEDEPRTDMSRVGCFRTLAPLMRPEVHEFPAMVRAYARMIERLIVDPELRASMGACAHERSRAFTWAKTSARVVQAYVDACRPSMSRCSSDPSSSSSASSTSSSHPSGEGEVDEDGQDTKVDSEARPLLLDASPDMSTHGQEQAAGWSQTVTEGCVWILDVLIVAYALVLATLSHAAYMVPTGTDFGLAPGFGP